MGGPTWGDKVELAVLLAPIAFVDHMQSPIKLIAPFSDLVQWVADHMGMGEFLPSNWLMDLIADFACGPNNPLEIICENVVFLLTGYDEKQMNKTMLPTIASHCPAGTSTYTVLQYAQEIKHKRFAGLDWGSDEKNIAHHGTPEPPVYNLRDVKGCQTAGGSESHNRRDLSSRSAGFQGKASRTWRRQSAQHANASQEQSPLSPRSDVCRRRRWEFPSCRGSEGSRARSARWPCSQGGSAPP